MSDKKQKYSNTPNKTPVLGVSEQLKQEFQLLYDTSLNTGCSKYATSTVDNLATILVCRKYSNLCFELSHFIWIILHSKGMNNAAKNRLLYFFWCENGHHKLGCKKYFEDCYKHYFSRFEPFNKITDSAQKQDTDYSQNVISVSSNMSLTIDKEFVCMDVNQYSFSIYYSRANLLACFVEWLVLIVPDFLVWISESLIGKGSTAVRETASALQKKVYDYLGNHLIPAKLQKKYQTMANFFGEKTPDCSLILAFWQQHKNQEGCSKYSNVVNDSIAYNFALETNSVSQSVVQSESIETVQHGSMAEQGYVYDALLARNTEINIDSLIKSPKLLNKNHIELLDFIIQFREFAQQLPSTFLRLNTFSSAQAKIIQAKRAKKITLTENYIQLTYQDIVEALNAVKKTNLQALMAIFVLLCRHQVKQSCVLLMDICKLSSKYSQYLPELKALLLSFFRGTESFSENEKALEKNDIEYIAQNVNAFHTAIEHWTLHNDWFNELMKDITDAYKSINRSGFTEKTQLKDSEYQTTINNTLKLNLYVNQMLNKIKKHKLSNAEKFQSDRSIFINEFNHLYLQDENKYE